MGLVDYDSDSGSDVERPVKPDPKPSQAPSKKPFQKVVDRANPGRIVVNLPSQTTSAANTKSDEPPAKRARTTGGGLFSGFNSFLPAPKNAGKQGIKPSSSSNTRPGVNLKTSAAPGFSRDGDEDDGAPQSTALGSTEDLPSGGLSLPPPRKQDPAPSIPEGQKPADEVKLVGKPLMFRPLSVGINAKKKKKNKPTSASIAGQNPAKPSQPASSSSTSVSTASSALAEPASKKKVSLFSMHTEEPADPTPESSANGAYEPLFESAHNVGTAVPGFSAPTHDESHMPTNYTAGGTESLDHIADDLNLSAAARRELFGRDGTNFAAKKVVNFNMDKEYQHNEDIRASGDQQIHNPVRALQGGKHSLKQLVQNVQNQKEALEDSFAKGRSNRKEASSRYGW